MDYTPSAYYQPADDLDAATPGRVVIDGDREYEYCEAEVAEIEDAEPTLRATESVCYAMLCGDHVPSLCPDGCSPCRLLTETP